MNQKNELFTSMPVGKAVAKLAVPTVISQIIVILYSLADTFFIGQIGDPNQIAALSITFPIYTRLTAAANLFGIGANSVIARSMGQNDEITTKRTSSFAFWASLVVTGVLSVLLAVFMTPVLKFFGANQLTLGFTADYLFWVFVIGGIPTAAGLVLGHLVRAVGKTKEAGIGLTIGGVMNIILDPIFIFVFEMDVAGAAVATMLSNVIFMFYLLGVLLKICRSTVLTLSPKYVSLEKRVSFGTLSVGFPAAISVLLVCVSISLLNGLLLRHEGGNILSAAYGVTSKCGTIALHISIGIAQGVMPLIGYSYGAKDHKRVHDVCRLAFRILWVFSVVFLLVVQLVPGPIVRLFILRDTAPCLTVFIHASDEKGAERIVTVYGQREESPAQRLHDKDKKRKAFYELYTGTQWGQADNYDLCLDSGKIGVDGCVNLITQLYQQGA